MRLLEITLCVSLGIMLIGYAWPVFPKPKIFTWFSFLVLIFFTVHLLVEKWRWQMVPAYVLIILLGLLEVPRLLHEPTPTTNTNPTGWALLGCLGLGLVKWVFMHLAWLSLLISVALGLILPVFKLPQPSGPYSIGMQDLYFKDTSRPEKFTKNINDRRELMVRVWYPARQVTGISPQPYWFPAHAIAEPVLKGYEIPTFGLDHLELVPTHSYPLAPAAEGEIFPVLVFSHGYGKADFTRNLTQMEELASHGYIVFSINHTCETWATVFPDGRVVPEYEFVPKELLAPEIWDASYDDQFGTWVEDTRYILDQIEALQSGKRESAVTGHLNLNKVGVFGTSFGGATAVEICLIDARCKAGANMDGSQFGYTDYRDKHLKKPFLFFYNEYSEGMNDYIYNGVENWAYRVTIAGTYHSNYGDSALWSPLSRYASVLNERVSSFGKIDQRRMIQIVNAYLLAFFDRHLKDNPDSLLNAPSPDFPEVDYRFHKP